MKKHIFLATTTLALCSLAGVRADLVGLWTFDNADDPREDSSGNTNTLTDPGNAGQVATWGGATGYNGSGGYTFDGSHRLIAPIDVNPGVMAQMTWGAWVRTDLLNAGLRKVMGHDNGGWDRTIGLDNRGGAFRYSSFTGFQRPVVGTLPGPVNTTDWTFIAASYNAAASNVTVYVDLDASTSADALVVAIETGNFNFGWTTFSIGSLRPDNPNEGWNGSIDNAFVFDEILDEARLSEIRRRGVPAILGIAEGDPAIAANPASLFGDLTGLGAGLGPVMRTVTISNAGATQNLNITGIAISGPDALLYTDTPGASTLLAPGESTDMEITLTPSATGGNFEAALEISSDDAMTPVLSIPLDAAVTSDPNIELVLTDPLFGTISSDTLPASIERTITIRNTGVVNTLTLSPGAMVSGADAASYIPVGPLSVAPGEESDLVVTLIPAGRDGAFVASLDINSDDADTPTITVSLDARLLPLKLLGFWCFDNPGDPFEDLSGEGNPLTNPPIAGQEAVWAAESGVDGSGGFSFNGTQRLLAPIDVNTAALPQMSWGAWVRTDNLTPGLRKVMGHDNGGWDRTIGLDNREGAFRYSSFTGFQRPVVGTLPGPDNLTDWTFLAASYDQDAQIVTVYVDIDSSTTTDPLVAVTEVGNFNLGWPTFSIGNLRPDNTAEGWAGSIDNAFIFQGFLNEAQMTAIRNGGSSFFKGGLPKIPLEVSRTGGDLVFTWDSAGGKLYNLRSETDPSASLPIDWPIFDGHADIAATPTENTLTIPMPADSERFFVIEEFNAPPVELLNEDFEGGANGWTWGSDLDPGTDWQLGLPTNGPAAAHSGSNCYGTNLDADYASDADIWLRSPEIDLTTAGGATLKFWHWYDTEQIIDLCTLSVVDSVTNNPIAVLDTYDFFNADWEEVTKVLPAAALGSKVKIEFRLTSDDAVFWPGWFVDDVLVTVP